MFRRERKRHQSIRLNSTDCTPLKKSAPKKSRKRVVRRWFVLILGILCLIQLAITKSDSPNIVAESPFDKKISIPDKYYRGELITIGKDALSLKSLKEVPTRPASLKGLDFGSDVAQKSQLDYSAANKLPLEMENSLGMKFRLIPPGSFVMGSPNDEPGRKKYVGKGVDIEEEHREELVAPFYVGKFEVTQANWKKVMGKLPREEFRLTGDNLPAVEISWIDAVKFCKKLAELEGVPEYRYRLLTEIEWEYVCRAGTEGPFYFKDRVNAKHFVVNDMNSRGCTSIVGTKRANAWGVYNMHGNVWEWCLDYYRSYFTREYLDAEECKQKNIRGGSWTHSLDECRSANRARLPALSVGNMLGFRIIRKIQAEIDELDVSKNMDDKNE